MASARLAQGWEQGFPAAPGTVLASLTAGYRALVGAREWLYARGVLRTRALGCRVASVGNLTVGGTGKTPAVELAVRTLTDLGHRPAVVSRGYRRQTRGVHVVADTASIRLDPEDAGDEPFLLARRLPGVPVVVGASRYEAARLAVQRFGVTAIVLDDGFQHRTLHKDLEIVMTRVHRPWGNERLLPAGPLREPLSALSRADLVVAVGPGDPAEIAAVSETVQRHAPGTPLVAARYAPVECWETGRMRLVPLTGLGSGRWLAFAGIAAPLAFARTLEDLGAPTLGFVPFADHHWYTRQDLERLEARARALGADGLVTTEKDWVRLKRLGSPGRPLYMVSIRLDLVSGHAEWLAAFTRACPPP